MGGKSSGGSQTTVQKADPWIGVQQNLLDLYGATGGWFHNANTVAGSNDDIQRSIAMGRQRATYGSTLGRSAQGLLEGITNGSYMRGNPVATGQMTTQNAIANGTFGTSNQFANGSFVGDNPYLSGMVKAASRDVNDQFMNDIAPSLASQFSMAGRLGSGSHEAAFGQAASGLAKRLGDISASIRGNAYENDMGRMFQAYQSERGLRANAYEAERGAQRGMFASMPQTTMQAAALAPQLAGMDYNDIQQLQNMGLLQRQIQQEQLEEPMKRIGLYSSVLNGAAPYAAQSGSSTSTQPYNKLSGAIGGGLGGYALANMILPGSGAIGAALGGLGGLFG